MCDAWTLIYAEYKEYKFNTYMKKTISLFCLILMMAIQSSFAASPKEEFRATWLATVWSIDWPKTSATTAANRTAQQKRVNRYL